MTAIMRKDSFEAAWSEEPSHRCLRIEANDEVEIADASSIFNPPGRLVWFKYQEDKLAVPEGREAAGTAPERMRTGGNGYILFTVGQAHESGLLQVIETEPGKSIQFSIWAHAWSNNQDLNRTSHYPYRVRKNLRISAAWRRR